MSGERSVGTRSRTVSMLLLVLAIAAGLAWLVWRPARSNVFIQTIERPVPTLDLASGRAGSGCLVSASLATGKPRLINLFASWCVPCIAEAEQLATMKREGVAITGIAVRDRPEAVAAFLARHGDPYTAVGLDPDSEAQRALGSAGVPETFVVDGHGTMVRRFIGGLDETSLVEVRKALADAAKAQAAFETHEKERRALFGSFTPAERWMVLADSYSRSGEYDKAAATIEAGLRAHPRDAILWTGLGLALTEQHGAMTAEADAAFDKAAALAPQSPGPTYFRGLALKRAGNLLAARAVWRSLLASAPAKASWRPMVERSLNALLPPGAGATG